MTPTGHGKTVFRRPQRRQVPVSKDRSPVPVAEPRRAVGCDASPQEVVARGSPQPPPPGSGAWEKPADAVVDELPPGKQQLMEKFFSPVQSARGGMGKGGSEGKPAEKDAHERHRQQREHQHPHHCHQQGAQWTKNKQNHSTGSRDGGLELVLVHYTHYEGGIVKAIKVEVPHRWKEDLRN